MPALGLEQIPTLVELSLSTVALMKSFLYEDNDGNSILHMQGFEEVETQWVSLSPRRRYPWTRADLHAGRVESIFDQPHDGYIYPLAKI